MNAWKTMAYIALLVLLGMSTSYAANTGELDPSFGEEGKVLTSFGQYGGQAYAVALQQDGKILAAGSASNGDDLDLAIARYNEDGTLDTSFSVDGKVWTSVGNGDDELSAIAVQDDGYIIGAGYTETDAGRDFVLVRFTPDGDLDHSFGEGGIVVSSFGNQNDEITAMTIDEEGRIAVCGYVTGTAGEVVAVARYLVSGAPDITFGDDGVILTDIGNNALARSIDIDAEGRIIVTGSYVPGKHAELMILRFLDTGKLDTGFGHDGVAVPLISEQSSEGYEVRSLDDGRILVAGTVGKEGDLDSALFRFLATGDGDVSFGENGVLVASASQEDDMALAMDVKGNVVGVSGFSTFNTKRDFLFVAVETAASGEENISLNQETGNFPSATTNFSTVFDTNGRQSENGNETEKPGVGDSVFTTTYFGYTDDVSYAVVLQEDGKAVSVGYSEQDGVPSFAVARYVTPVANSTAGGGNPTVSWILTKEPTSVNRTGAITGGHILATGLTITQRGVVYSIAPDPVYKSGQDVTNPDTNPSPTPTVPNPGDTTPPTITGDQRIDLAAGSTETTLTITTNENATCKYTSTGPGMDYSNMKQLFDTTGGKSHSEPIRDLTTGENKFYIRCQDDNGNSNTTDFIITVNVASSSTSGLSSSAITSSVDTSSSQFSLSLKLDLNDEPLIVSNGSPSGEIAAGSAMTYIGVYTSDKSECRYATRPEPDFDFMTEAMATADNLSHIAKITGLEDDHSYSFYVRCRSEAGKANAHAYKISFRVAAPWNGTVGQSLQDAIGNFFVTRAFAEDSGSSAATSTTNTSTTSSPSSAFDLTSPEYSEEGFTDDGGGTGSFSSILKNLRPGTFYYVRAYAVDENNNVYYGPQVGFKTADACFIATAAYGTLLHPYVKVLRNFRDRYMLTNALGRNLVDLYYHYSPPAADYIASRPVVRGVARGALLPVVGVSWLILHIGFAGLALLAVLLIMPFMLIIRSYRRLKVC